nr:MAG TPA: capsid protein [Cressdnaviricota sp.]
MGFKRKFKRGGFRKKRVFRKKRTFRKKRMYYKRLSRTLTKLRRPPVEVKRYYSGVTPSLVSTSAQLYSLNVSIIRGTNADQRIGRNLTIKAITFEYHIEPPQGTTSTSQNDLAYVRIGLVWFPTGRAPAVDLWVPAISGNPLPIYTTFMPSQQTATENQVRYKVLYDKVHDVRNYSYSVTGLTSFAGFRRVTKKLKIRGNFRCMYDPDSDSVRVGELLLYYESDRIAGVHNLPVVTSWWKLSYLDA